MENVLKKRIIKISKEAAFILVTIACAILLPQILHGAGVLLGVGGKLGQMFLPMYLPVLIIGFYRGYISGTITGLLSPIISFAITEMPTAALLPYITVELVALGVFSGIFAKIKMPAILRVISAVAIAKAIRLLVHAIVLLASSGAIAPSVLFAGIVTSIPGIIIQLAVVTVFVIIMEKRRNA